MTRKCKTCGEEKPLETGFYKYRGKYYDTDCKPCHNRKNSAQTKRRRTTKEGRERYNKYMREYLQRKKSERRAKEIEEFEGVGV